MRLEGRGAIVTGGSQGIGEAIALRYAKEGASVALVYHLNDENAARVVQAIRNLGGNAVANPGFLDVVSALSDPAERGAARTATTRALTTLTTSSANSGWLHDDR